MKVNRYLLYNSLNDVLLYKEHCLMEHKTMFYET